MEALKRPQKIFQRLPILKNVLSYAAKKELPADPINHDDK